MYYEEQLTPSPVTTIEMIGASGVSEESLNDALSQDECNSEQLNSTDVSIIRAFGICLADLLTCIVCSIKSIA